MTNVVNPWTYNDWNLTDQGQFVLKYGMEKAQKAAEAAHTTVGGMRPKPEGTINVHQTFLFRKTFQTGGGGGGGIVGAGSSGDGPPS